jgi:elongation factor G
VLAFEIAARQCFREGIPKCGLNLLEPIMRVQVVAPMDRLPFVASDLEKRRAQIVDIGSHAVDAKVPLANMFGYAKALASLSLGLARLRGLGCFEDTR